MTDKNSSNNNSIKYKLDVYRKALGFEQTQISPLKTPINIDFYEKWLKSNVYGSMNYLKDHFEIKKNPKTIQLGLSQDLTSVISIAQSYFPAVTPVKSQPARVAMYAQNEDYHFWLKAKLNDLIRKLTADYPNEIFLPFVDSGPIMERDLAYQNQIGWFGKNTCLINPKHGSLFFIAEILTSLSSEEVSTLEPLPDFCGKCTACIDVCPTNAIKEDHFLQADQCISYLTIEAKTAPPENLRKKIGDWFFGCDLCQTVCPWNQKVFKKNADLPKDKISTDAVLSEDLVNQPELVEYFRFLLTASNKQIQKHHFGSPLLRAGAKGLKRNALIVIANRDIQELYDVVSSYANEDLIELAHWTKTQLVNQKA